VSVHAPFWMGAGTVGIAVVILAVGAKHLRGEELPASHDVAEAELIAAADAT
jgi:hypothetical protein